MEGKPVSSNLKACRGECGSIPHPLLGKGKLEGPS